MGKKQISIYETYKNTVMPHGCHIYAKASYMENATMGEYPQSDNALTHWRCVIQYCEKFPCVNLPDQ